MDKTPEQRQKQRQIEFELGCIRFKAVSKGAKPRPTVADPSDLNSEKTKFTYWLGSVPLSKFNTLDRLKPDCFNKYDWFFWQFYASRVVKTIPQDYCRDCTPWFKGEMLKVNRCSSPEAFFHWQVKKDRDSDLSEAELVGESLASFIGRYGSTGIHKFKVKLRGLLEKGEVVTDLYSAHEIIKRLNKNNDIEYCLPTSKAVAALK